MDDSDVHSSPRPSSGGWRLLLIILGVILVGIIVAVGIMMFTELRSTESAETAALANRAAKLESVRAELALAERGSYIAIDTVMYAVYSRDENSLFLHTLLKHGSVYHLELNNDQQVSRVRRIYRYRDVPDAAYAAASYRYWNQ